MIRSFSGCNLDEAILGLHHAVGAHRASGGDLEDVAAILMQLPTGEIRGYLASRGRIVAEVARRDLEIANKVADDLLDSSPGLLPVYFGDQSRLELCWIETRTNSPGGDA